MYMTLTGSDKDKVGRICQILPKVASECLKVPQSASNGLKKCPKVLKTGGKQADLQKPSKRGGDAHLVRFKVELWSFCNPERAGRTVCLLCPFLFSCLFMAERKREKRSKSGRPLGGQLPCGRLFTQRGTRALGEGWTPSR